MKISLMINDTSQILERSEKYLKEFYKKLCFEVETCIIAKYKSCVKEANAFISIKVLIKVFSGDGRRLKKKIGAFLPTALLKSFRFQF